MTGQGPLRQASRDDAGTFVVGFERTACRSRREWGFDQTGGEPVLGGPVVVDQADAAGRSDRQFRTGAVLWTQTTPAGALTIVVESDPERFAFIDDDA